LFVALPLVLTICTSAFAQAPGPGGWKLTANALQPDSQFTLNLGKENATPQRRSLRPTTRGEPLVSVIVKLSAESLASYQGGIAGLPATSPAATGAEKLDVTAPESQLYLQYLAKQEDTFVLNAKNKLPAVQVTNRFDILFGGVSMLVPASQVDQVASLPGVKAVFEDTLQKPLTDRTPQFIGAPTVWNKLGGQESAGDSVVIGVLDTGIWPEHLSFSDPDPSGKAYGPKPSGWKGTTCTFGNTAFNPDDVPFTCNNKLVGAARFMSTYDALVGIGPGEFASARDDDGHGTHTASTAGGNASVEASIFGVPRGIVSGIAPRARVAAYKVCGPAGCYSSDSAAAVQQAIKDGVNVINFSISGGANPFADAVELAFLDAYNAGVFVAASAGNAGPTPETTDHRGPWVTTVAASTADRAFVSTLTLVAGSNTYNTTGTSVTAGVPTPMPVVNAGDAPYNDPLCLNSAADNAFAGKVVICRRGSNGRVAKGFNVLQRGAVGMILYNQSAAVTDLETDNHFLPTVHIQFAQGQALVAFLVANPTATASWPAAFKSTQQGDVMASFSSRGGPQQSLGVSKPDITAPGVQILAGRTRLSVDIAAGPNGELFQAIAGTSMSSPHIAGSAALLKALHPKWTPGQIKSALMTTAKTSVVKEDGTTPANAFDDGSGRVDLTQAGMAQLTFDETGADYVALQDKLWNANYPSLYVPVMPGSIEVTRTVHNETNRSALWMLSVSAPTDVTIFVPRVLFVPAKGTATFSIRILAPNVPLGETRFATLSLKNQEQTLHFPITFVRKQPVVTLQKTCDMTVKLGSTVNCTITATNLLFTNTNVTVLDWVPWPLLVNPKSVTGANVFANLVTFKGTLAAAQPPDVHVGPGASPAGYLPLADFGITPIAGVGDDTVTNFNVPAFKYGGQTYTRLGVGSNGAIIVGGSTGATDATPVNQNFPDPTRPNNVLAPFWTDLNPTAGGAVRIGTLSDGVTTWIVVDWAAVKEFSTPVTDTFQVWLQTGATEGVSFTYGPVNGRGDGGFLTVGAENLFGNRGQSVYYNGTGTLPTSTTELAVTTAPPQPGGTHVITLQAKALMKGKWQNCAVMTSNAYQGENIVCFNGEVTK
jgi:subtilisin family serine protease